MSHVVSAEALLVPTASATDNVPFCFWICLARRRLVRRFMLVLYMFIISTIDMRAILVGDSISVK